MPPPTSTSTSLPSQRAFIASLLSQLPSVAHSPNDTTSSPTTTNPLTSPSAPSSLKPLFLTLHCLFPTDLLPALDLLDRNLITRFVLDYSPAEAGARNVVYYVRSSQRPRGYYKRGGNHEGLEGSTSYEVRLKAWNCTCAAFAFAAFNSGAPRRLVQDDGEAEGKGGGEMRFGGLWRGEEVPVCKHLLACVFVERMGGYVEEKVVGREEMAGWAAGWGG